ncbi:hypothetical protein EDD22DRAFT_959413 [Suillus occidentalis]|nr:hypothetical protein EDD22DRAFT_959413 [Suillus occidentalis]
MVYTSGIITDAIKDEVNGCTNTPRAKHGHYLHQIVSPPLNGNPLGLRWSERRTSGRVMWTLWMGSVMREDTQPSSPSLRPLCPQAPSMVFTVQFAFASGKRKSWKILVQVEVWMVLQLSAPDELIPYLLQPEVASLRPDITAVCIQSATKLELDHLHPLRKQVCRTREGWTTGTNAPVRDDPYYIMDGRPQKLPAEGVDSTPVFRLDGPLSLPKEEPCIPGLRSSASIRSAPPSFVMEREGEIPAGVIITPRLLTPAPSSRRQTPNLELPHTLNDHN